MSFAELSLWRKAVVAAIGVLVIAGIYDALRNLPVVSGCAFYDNCPADLPPDPINAPNQS